ncbi:MAG: hypothetical protein GY926_21295 [bacterium]|nr:hypothetical protein [bacterium]
MSDEENITGQRVPENPHEAVQAQFEARVQAVMDGAERQRAEAAGAAIELAEAPFLQEWEVLAWGPWQGAANDPKGIVFTGESVWICVGVFLSVEMAATVGGFGGKISLNYFTSDTQQMKVAAGLSGNECIEVDANTTVYFSWLKLDPTEAACLLETNICARICNCRNETHPDYAGYVRHVYDYDPENLGLTAPWGPVSPSSPGWQFGHPIRFMVADPKAPCCL